MAKIVYFAYFHSVISYAILLWGKAANIKQIFIFQKRAVRAIYRLRSRESLREKFKEIGILTVASQYIFNNVVFIRKNINAYKQHFDINNRHTKRMHQLVTPSFRLSKVQRSFIGLGIHFYSKIPKLMRDLPIETFKKRVKTQLLGKGYYSVDEYLNDKDAWK